MLVCPSVLWTKGGGGAGVGGGERMSACKIFSESIFLDEHWSRWVFVRDAFVPGATVRVNVCPVNIYLSGEHLSSEHLSYTRGALLIEPETIDENRNQRANQHGRNLRSSKSKQKKKKKKKKVLFYIFCNIDRTTKCSVRIAICAHVLRFKASSPLSFRSPLKWRTCTDRTQRYKRVHSKRKLPYRVKAWTVAEFFST